MAADMSSLYPTRVASPIEITGCIMARGLRTAATIVAAGLAAQSLASTAGYPADAVDAAPRPFVARCGTQLCVDGVPARFAGANLYWLGA